MKHIVERKDGGFTLAELLFVLVMICVVVVLLLPRMVIGRASPKRVQCFMNLKTLGLTTRIFAIDHGDAPPSWWLTIKDGNREIHNPTKWIVDYYESISNELHSSSKTKVTGMPPWKLLSCPSDTRIPPKWKEPLSRTNISYFVSPDLAQEKSEEILFGDRNLTTNGVDLGTGLAHLSKADANGWSKLIHVNQGNIVQADGSVHQYSSLSLADRIQRGTNERVRLVIP